MKRKPKSPANSTSNAAKKRTPLQNVALLNANVALEKKNTSLEKSNKEIVRKGIKEKASLNEDIRIEKHSNRNLKKSVEKSDKEVKSAETDKKALLMANSLLKKSNKKITRKGLEEKAAFTVQIQ